jgi:hypothetical protein
MVGRAGARIEWCEGCREERGHPEEGRCFLTEEMLDRAVEDEGPA